MIYITQLIYLKPGQEEIFRQFEDLVLPILAKYKATFLLRIRPRAGDIITTHSTQPDEVHLLKFDTESDFQNFMHDEGRKKFLHLKETSIQSVFLIKGTAVSQGAIQ